ncbi:MAG TPA: NADH-quinone oxidoreductase subunit C, partial [Acidimicrobiales bacterium]|nr:NADH-quinone oxidoreductase subunit C [Acidimicrobiales bacterium]
ATPGAAWYERQLHDLWGLVPVGHPRLDPLVRPGPDQDGEAARGEASLPAHVGGEGLFTIPYGPVRSGVVEAVEYLVETPGENIPHLRTRIHHKHRGVSARFEGLDPSDGVLLAERVEGVAGVAHALCLARAVEALADTEAPRRAALVRVVHAELERVANHLDTMVRHTEGAGQAVAHARLGLHKERVLRLRARLCGHRFGRGVVIPGGVAGPPALHPGEASRALADLAAALSSDTAALMATPSFLERLRGTGVLPPVLAATLGALGPVGRGSGLAEDLRVDRPYDGYAGLQVTPAAPRAEGDALARQHVRLTEVAEALALCHQALAELAEEPDGPWSVPLPPAEGRALAGVEAPQGELLYLVDAREGRLQGVSPRSASFHNLGLFHHAFRGDIFTDVVFIEASWGVSIAGASG